MERTFNKNYDPKSVEDKWYSAWQENNIYKTSNDTGKEPYSILMPPPNVTGILHFGHVLNITLQDLYIRWKRMLGYEACWFPGIDHAGIATQAKVEHLLKDTEGLSKHDLGREAFVERVWDWKENYGGTILRQMRRLGVSCDWDRTLFTLDEGASNAVRQVFIRLFDEGLIYRGKRIINWSPSGQTALSDEEVEHREVSEQLYTLRYYFEKTDGDNSAGNLSEEYLQIATVRTETIFGDIAVAVNPKDERFSKYIGKNVIVPLAGRVVPVIADEHADPEFGTGVVKITPAHDPNDFHVGRRHNLEMINTISPDGTLNENAGEFCGLDRFDARKKIVAELKQLGLIEKIEDYTHKVGFSQRGGEPVEPLYSDQWFVKMKPLAELALEAVENGEVQFHPKHWTKTYKHWMNNIRDWCISRQLWWGHRIPVYYAEDGSFTAAISEEAARQKLGLPPDTILTQDEDVLDTWFSSWLWPMTTMRWLEDGQKEDTPDLEKFLPTDLLVTGPDIIFFWVARMVMASTKFKDKIPFRHVYFTSTIRDGKGLKLSKSLGNSPDPLNIIDKYGCDAVRFTIIYLSPMGQDVKMDVDVKAQDVPSMEIGRNFANKIWNAGRFLMMKRDLVIKDVNIEGECRPLSENELSIADRWIRSRYNTTILKLKDALDRFKVTEYSKILYDFIWRDFCSWYVEIIKVQLDGAGDDPLYKHSLMKFTLDIYDGILKLIHPVMPFISEEIWHLTASRGNNNNTIESISLQAVPEGNDNLIDAELEAEFALVQSLVEEIRKLRSSMNLPPQQKLPVCFSCKDKIIVEFLGSQSGIIAKLAHCSDITTGIGLAKPDGAVASVVKEIEIFISAAGIIDIDKERERLQKEIKRLEGNIFGINKKLSNDRFVNNAPKEVVDRERKKLSDMTASLNTIKDNLSNL